jgi:Zn-dependent protease
MSPSFCSWAWIGFSYYQVGGPAVATQGVLFMVALFGCVLLHEFGHGLAARAFGIRTPDITLLPIGGVAHLQRVPDKSWRELAVAIAGPLVNGVLAAGLIFVLRCAVHFPTRISGTRCHRPRARRAHLARGRELGRGNNEANAVRTALTPRGWSKPTRNHSRQ